MTTRIYGIKNCDTMKKAFKWLDAQGINYEFQDYKKEAPSEEQANVWVKQLGWENVINKRGTTWRKLDDEIKESMNDQHAVKVMLENPSIIKRPLLEHNGQTLLGFKEADYQTLFNS
ncbi:ArsC family reductase [Litoribrevibacter euphylliae]|uniref:ArsC family reductase n=1 Tax=Litoribrevibacter euphylliae TaxID=1834034 RepID=A0ABV7HFK0_9GAMM